MTRGFSGVQRACDILADYQFIRAQQTKDRARLLIQQIKIQIIVGQTASEVFHNGDPGLHLIELRPQCFGFG